MKGISILPESSGIEHGQHRGRYQARQRNQNIGNASGNLGLIAGIRRNMRLFLSGQNFLMPELRPAHGPEIKVQSNNQKHKAQTEYGIEIPGNAGDKNHKGSFRHGFGNQIRAYRHRPGRNRCNNADGGRRGINDKGQLFPGNPLRIGHRFHDSAHRKTVKVIVYENHNPQKHGGKQGLSSGFQFPAGPVSVLPNPARSVDDADKRAQKSAEYRNLQIEFCSQYFQRYLCGTNQKIAA